MGVYWAREMKQMHEKTERTLSRIDQRIYIYYKLLIIVKRTNIKYTHAHVHIFYIFVQVLSITFIICYQLLKLITERLLFILCNVERQVQTIEFN